MSNERYDVSPSLNVSPFYEAHWGEVIAAAAPPRQDGGGWLMDAITDVPCKRPGYPRACPERKKPFTEVQPVPQYTEPLQNQPPATESQRTWSLTYEPSLPEKVETDIGNLSIEYSCGGLVGVVAIGLILFPRYVIGVIKFVGKAIFRSK